MSHESIEQAVFGLGDGLADEAVVIGSGAVKLALPGFREPNDTDLALSEGAFSYLHSQPDWQEVTDPGGATRLLKDGFDVGVGWGPTNFEDLKARSWRTPDGLQVAGLPDVYAYKQRRESDLDVYDMTAIRERLHDPAQAPLLARLIPHEVAVARGCLPEELQDDPDAQDAILLAANGMHIVYTLYGHPQIGQANQIVGDVEAPEYQVPATYHNGFGLVDDMQRLQQHLKAIKAPIEDRLLGLAIDPYTDAVYGNGRFRHNPKGHDELRSAELLRARALYLGFSQEQADRKHDITLETTFDEDTGSQRGKDSTDLLARGVVAVDLQPLAEPNSVETSIDVAVEDSFSARYSAARTVGRVLCAHGERVRTTADALLLIDRYATERPAPDGPTVMQAFAGRLAQTTDFHRRHGYPADWTFDNKPMREDHAVKLEDLSSRLLAGEIPATEAHQEAKLHTNEMSVRYI